MTSEAAFPLTDLTACDREPITLLEQIQDFGFLLAMAGDWTVARASANLSAMLGVDAAAAIGMPLESLISAEAAQHIRNRLAILRAHGGTERLYGIALKTGRAPYDLAVHYAADLLVLEGEPSGESEGADAALLVRAMVARLNRMKTMDAFHRDAARQVRALTGFQRVMIYRFDDSGDGEVIAESLSRPSTSFLGLRYPAADIPAQARRLYLRNPFRIIGDVDRATVPLLPPPSKTTPRLDLSLAVTRAVSPVHLEYLRNMGVSASLSISIIVDGRLWGLIACHNDRPCVPRFVQRSASELFAQMYSMILESRTREAASLVEAAMRKRVDQLISAIAGDMSLLGDPARLHARLDDAIGCDGLAVIANGRVAAGGYTPAPDRLDAIVDALRLFQVSEVFSTDSLVATFPKVIEPGSPIAGMLSIPLSPDPADYLLLFRREQPQDVRWGGDPAEADFKHEPDVRISPRKSFEAFTVLTRDRSAPFTDAMRETAELIRTTLIDIVFRVNGGDGTGARVSGRQELLIAELNHRVRNVLALIRGLINQTPSDEHDVAGYVESLNGRVQALARAHDQVTRQHWGPGRLSGLFDHQIDAHVPMQRERLRVAGPTVYLVPLAFSTMALVVHELVTNSLKYGALSAAGRVEVRVDRRDGLGLYLSWREVDGPAVKPPIRRGFGTAIIEKTIPHDLHGSADVRYAVAGLEVDLFVPERFLWVGDVPVADASPAARASLADGSTQPLSALNVLLLEDNMIGALETEDMLRALGATNVCAVSSVQAARQANDREVFDFAVLDVTVGDQARLDFARECAERRIPFVFASGSGHDLALGELHRQVAVIDKPYRLEDLDRAATEALRLHRLQDGTDD